VRALVITLSHIHLFLILLLATLFFADFAAIITLYAKGYCISPCKAEENTMEYEFLRDVTGRVLVRMSMGHEVVGHWFNEEVKDNLALLDDVEEAANSVKGSERQWQRVGHEYTVLLDGEEVMIRANQLEISGDEMEDGMNYYDEESLSFCGVEDFMLVITAYREFVSNH
jgi:uncharacterized protein YacL (UPF0231 family)